jgi:septum site-determining protein MinC
LGAITTKTRQTLRFRGKSYLALVLAPVAPLDTWVEEVSDLSRRSPGFFSTRSVVLDLAEFAGEASEVKGLIASLEALGIRIMGVENARNVSVTADMPPVLAGGRHTPDVDKPSARRKATSSTPSMTVENVRSGQSVVCPDGDVTVIGSVASGAEVIAAGSVHVYGTLRGRVIAGAYGNPKARIFCRKLQAEFLAIDAVYLTAEAIEAEVSGQSVQIWSEHESIKLSILR